MIVQLNLLPDVKQRYIKSKRTQRTTILIATLVSGSTLALFILLLFSVHIVQKKNIRDLNSDIAKYTKQLQDTPDLDRILTVQQQLNTLSGLHKSKPAAKRLFGYLSKVTPAQATISEIDIDFSTGGANIKGGADSIETINKFADTLKFTKFKTDPASNEEKPAFKDVVLVTYAKDANGASYEITLSLDVALFDANAPGIELAVPKNFITTRSETEKPQDLFKAQPTDETLQEQAE